MNLIEMTLTDEQKALVTENHQLIYGFLSKNGLEIEEFYDLAAIGLCNAAINYRDSDELFSTYAYICMKNVIFNEIRRLNGVKKVPERLISSYNVPIPGCEDDEIEILDTFKSTFNVEKHVLDQIILEKLMKKLSGKHKNTLILSLKGYNNSEIADFLGCTPTYISKLKKKIALIWGEI